MCVYMCILLIAVELLLPSEGTNDEGNKEERKSAECFFHFIVYPSYCMVLRG